MVLKQGTNELSLELNHAVDNESNKGNEEHKEKILFSCLRNKGKHQDK